MDVNDRFDDLLRTAMGAASRRGLLCGLWYGLVAVLPLGFADAEANNRKKKRKHKKNRSGKCRPTCIDRTCGDDGCGGSCGTCAAGQLCQGGTCICAPEPRNTTCGGRCGDRINNCGEIIGCPTCSGGRVCLSNGSCATVCPGDSCPSGCGCSISTTEGQSHCIANGGPPGEECMSTADCPFGQHCQGVMPSGNRCIGLC
jgi:hypothetical protein